MVTGTDHIRTMTDQAEHSHWCKLDRDGKVRFGPVLQGIFENPEPDYWFGPQIIANLGPDRRFGPKRSGSGSQEV